MCVLVLYIAFKLFCGGKRLAVDLLSEEYGQVSERDSEPHNVIPHWCRRRDLIQISEAGGPYLQHICTPLYYQQVN